MNTNLEPDEHIEQLLKRQKLGFITRLERQNINYELGKYIEKGYKVKLSNRAKKGARRLYNAYKRCKEDLIWEKHTSRDLSLMNESKYQLFLSGLSELTWENVLDLNLNPNFTTPQSHDTCNTTTLFDDTQVAQNTLELPGLDQYTPEPSDLVWNTMETAGIPQNILELFDEPIELDL